MQQESSQDQDRRMVKTATPGIFKRGARYVVVYRDPQGRQRKRFARTLAEARDLKAALTADVRRGEYRALSRITFGEYAPTWLDTYSGRTSRGIRPETLAGYRAVIEREAVPFFGRLRLTEIEPRDVKQYAARIAARGVSANTVRLAVAPVRALLATAVEEGLIRYNPAAGLRLTTEAVQRERVKVLAEDELRALLAATPERYRLVVSLLAATGLRVGEALGLTWADVDLGQRRLRVERRLYRGRLDVPKSRYGRRELPLAESIAQALWRERGTVADSAPVFPFEYRSVLRAVKTAAEAAGVPWATVHTLRHSAATAAFRSGWNAVQVQALLGHHSASFTLATYVHALPGDLPEPSFADAILAPEAPRGGNNGATEAAENGRNDPASLAAIPG